MALDVVVFEPDAFQQWLAGQRLPARVPVAAEAQRGAERLLSYGCGACHAVRGTPADGVIGPDLTHIGSRLTVGASLLENGPEGLARWIIAVERLKPAAHMPGFAMIPAEDVRAMAAYLAELQ
jgi:cytochrome c oxidase subunit 2